MKTLSIFILAALFLNINLKGENKIENTPDQTGIRKQVVFLLAPEELINQNTNAMIAEVERKDVSRINFRTNIQQVTETALGTDLADLDYQKNIAFKIELNEVGGIINLDQALYELAVAEVAFKLNIHDVMQNLARTDCTVLKDESHMIKFALNATQVENYAKSVNLNELIGEQQEYANK